MDVVNLVGFHFSEYVNLVGYQIECVESEIMRAVDEVNKRLFSNETSLWNMWNKACIQFDPLSGLISLGSVQIQGKWWEGSPF